jgi:two-component system sensor histidine kinase SenX3
MSPAAAVLLGLVGAGLGVAVVATVVARSRAMRRLDAAARRLDPSSPSPVQPGIGPQVARVERAADAALATREREAEVGRRLASAIDAIPQGIVICDAAGDVVFRNAVGERFSGARHGEALVAVAVDDLLAQARGGELGQDTLELFGPPRRVIAVTSFPLGADPDGDPSAVGGLVVIDDISERRRLEQVRRDFVANISHELKTPVGALALLAETIVAEEDEAVRSRLAERMLTEADRVGHTIDDLLSLSRIEAEGIPRTRVSVAAVIEEAVARTRPAAELRSIAIHVQAPEGRADLLGDRPQLVSALFNLLENAVKFSEDGADVRVVGRVDGPWIELAVVDRGVGIPARDLERVFERFYRVDRARSRETGGTGLGLAIVRHVMVNHDGEARVTSAEGEGSTFTLRLPAAPVDLEPQPALMTNGSEAP